MSSLCSWREKRKSHIFNQHKDDNYYSCESFYSCESELTSIRQIFKPGATPAPCQAGSVSADASEAEKNNYKHENKVDFSQCKSLAKWYFLHKNWWLSKQLKINNDFCMIGNTNDYIIHSFIRTSHCGTLPP